MGLLRPASDPDQKAAGDLFGFLYFKAGGAGPDHIYRDAETTKALFKRLDEWKPVFWAGYNPGWKYKPTSRVDLYDQTVRNHKVDRIAQLEHYAALINDQTYYAASQELEEIKKRNPQGISTKSADGERAQQLNQIMREVASRTPKPPKPRFEGSQRHLFEPDADAEFTQLLVGFNGPDSPGTDVFERDADVRASWLGKALTDKELERVLARVDFQRQIVVALTVGRRETATGDLLIRDVKYDASTQSLTVSGAVGVNDEECDQARAISHPFAIAVAPKPERVPRFPGYAMSNFPDGCKPPKVGTATLRSPSPSNASP